MYTNNLQPLVCGLSNMVQTESISDVQLNKQLKKMSLEHLSNLLDSSFTVDELKSILNQTTTKYAPNSTKTYLIRLVTNIYNIWDLIEANGDYLELKQKNR